jgi:hypothetical protein
MGDLNSGLASLANSFGTTPTNMLLIAGGTLLLAWGAYSLLSGASRAVKSAGRKVRSSKRAGSGALQSQNPVWQTLLLVGLAGGAVYYLTGKQGQA